MTVSDIQTGLTEYIKGKFLLWVDLANLSKAAWIFFLIFPCFHFRGPVATCPVLFLKVSPMEFFLD